MFFSIGACGFGSFSRHSCSRHRGNKSIGQEFLECLPYQFGCLTPRFTEKSSHLCSLCSFREVSKSWPKPTKSWGTWSIVRSYDYSLRTGSSYSGARRSAPPPGGGDHMDPSDVFRMVFEELGVDEIFERLKKVQQDGRVGPVGWVVNLRMLVKD